MSAEEQQTRKISDVQLKEAQQNLEKAIALINEDKTQQAVELLEQILQVYVDKYGEVTPEVAPIYYRYGQALLFLAQDAGKEFGGVSKPEALNMEDYNEDEDEDYEEYTESEEEEEEPTGEAKKEPQEIEQQPQLQPEEGTTQQSEKLLATSQSELDQTQNKEGQETPGQDEVVNKSAEQIQNKQDKDISQAEDVQKDDSKDKDIEQQIGLGEQDIAQIETEADKQETIQQEKEGQQLDEGVEDQAQKGEPDDTQGEEQQEELTGVEADLFLAWQNLEAARCIYEKHADGRNQSELAEIHLCLGDVSAEREDFECAIEDYTKCIQFFNAIKESSGTNEEQNKPSDEIPPASNSSKQQHTVTATEAAVKDSQKQETTCSELIVKADEQSLRVQRRNAEAHFRLALVLQYSLRYKEAQSYIETALDMLNKHHEVCKQAMEESTVDGENNKQYVQKYLDNLPGTIEDLKGYLEELKMCQATTSLTGIKAAIEKATLVAQKEDQGGEGVDGQPCSSNAALQQQPLGGEVQDLGVFGRSKKKQDAASPTAVKENQDTQNIPGSLEIKQTEAKRGREELQQTEDEGAVQVAKKSKLEQVGMNGSEAVNNAQTDVN